MLYHFEATRDFFVSLKEISILSKLASQDDGNRMLFLKLSVVSMVTKFQVYVEKVLKEFLFQIKTSKKLNNQLPLHVRLNSLRLLSSDYNLLKNLDNPEDYGNSKYKEVNQHVAVLIKHCDDGQPVCEEYCLNTKFPMGKTGANELLGLLRQIEGVKNIFEVDSIDIETLNAILNIRHNIIHQDANPAPLTEVAIKGYMMYFRDMVFCIDKYLGKFCL